MTPIYEEEYTEQLDSLSYHIQYAECLISQTSLYKSAEELRELYWELLACVDTRARLSLITEYKNGGSVYQDAERAKFWKNWHDDVVQLSESRVAIIIAKLMNYPFVL